MSDLGELVAEHGFGAAWTVVRHLPEPAAYATFDQIADASWRRRGRQVRRLESNLARVLGPSTTPARLRSVSRQGMRSYLRYWCDAFRLPGWSRERIRDSIVIHGEQVFAEALGTGRGVVCALPHMGNWDHAGAWACVKYQTVVTVAERLKPEDLYQKFLGYRRALGMEVLPLTGGDPPFPTLLRRLRAGGLVALLGDRDLTDSGIEVDFFGSPARFPPGPAALAVQTGAVLLAPTLWSQSGRNHVAFHPAVEVPLEGPKAERIARTTQAVADSFAASITAHPGDWHMLQRLWSEDLDPARRAAR
jgi:KDO2-lipid IV(A) lauroyltransferase